MFNSNEGGLGRSTLTIGLTNARMAEHGIINGTHMGMVQEIIKIYKRTFNR